MSGYVSYGYTNLFIFIGIIDDKIIIITSGFITINTAACDVQPFDLWICSWK